MMDDRYTPSFPGINEAESSSLCSLRVQPVQAPMNGGHMARLASDNIRKSRHCKKYMVTFFLLVAFL